jgi:hypothetical protein
MTYDFSRGLSTDPRLLLAAIISHLAEELPDGIVSRRGGDIGYTPALLVQYKLEGFRKRPCLSFSLRSSWGCRREAPGLPEP